MLIHARLDPATARVLRDLQRQLGWNGSRIVREGIKSLSGLVSPGHRRRIIGLGKFESGIPDLGSNKAHLKGFGH
jgi:hypothetical protein